MDGDGTYDPAIDLPLPGANLTLTGTDEKARGSSSWALTSVAEASMTPPVSKSRLVRAVFDRMRESVTRVQGLYQIGDVYPRSWVVISTSSGISMPNRNAS